MAQMDQPVGVVEMNGSLSAGRGSLVHRPDGHRPTTMTSTESILPPLRQQAECYRRLAKLAAMQRQYVQQGRTESLLEVLQRRQVELDEAGRLETAVAPARRNWSAYAERLNEADRTEAEALMRKIRELLEEITAADRDDVLVLQQRKLNLGRQINQARAAGRVNQTYAAAAYGKRPGRMDVGG